jgi:hypothetical protein
MRLQLYNESLKEGETEASLSKDFNEVYEREKKPKDTLFQDP